jgi:hypothetical protein
MPSIGKHKREQTPGPPAPAQPEPLPWPPLAPIDTDPAGPPADLEDLIPGPLGGLRDYLRSVAESIEVPVELPLMLMLPVISAAISGKRELYCGGSWKEPPPLWTMTLLGPGNRKSAVFSEIIRPVRLWEKLASAEAAPRLARDAHRRELAEKRLAYLRTRITQNKAGLEEEAEADELVADLADAAGEPVPQLISSEITTEALTGLLARNGERALVTSAEPDVLEVIMGRYNSGRANYGVWLAGHAADSHGVDRAGGKRIFLTRPCVSIGLVPQPAAVRRVLGSEEAKGRGFVARFLMCCPRDPIGSRPLLDKAIDETARRTWHDLVQTLLGEPMPPQTGGASGSHPGPARQYALSRAARGALHGFRVELEHAMGASGDLNDRKDYGSKLSGAVARIALAFHAAEQAIGLERRGWSAGEISQATMEAAIRFGEWLTAHDAVAQGLASADPDRVMASMIVKLLRREGRPQIKRTEIYEGVRGRQGGPSTTEELDRPIEILLEHEILRELDPCPGGKPKPNQRLYAVHPEVTR